MTRVSSLCCAFVALYTHSDPTVEDYKDDFGTWIPDSDLPVFDATRRDLLETRSIVSASCLFLRVICH